MCGIAGFFSRDAIKKLPPERLRGAAERMALRGPDAEGFFEQPGIAFAHRRLKVIDLVGGQQPLTHPETGVCLTYNGEIYNYRELRSQLIGCGHAFNSECDTEVLLKAYLEWGESCLDHLVGIFAFGIYDPRKEKLFLARDRAGAKPLYFTRTNSELSFASSIPALLEITGKSAEVDEVALLHYLTTIRSVMGSQTLFSNVHTLEPGCCLSIKRAAFIPTVRRYWEYPIVPDSEKSDVEIEDATNVVRELVEGAIREQLVSDVPLGGFLSGGIDSTVIASVANKHSEFNAYGVGYGEHDCNEWPFIRLAAATYGMKCEEIHLDSSNFTDQWRFLIRQKGLPLSTPNEVPIYELSRALKRDFTVALSGEGADEVFGGYIIPYFSAFDYERARHTPMKEGEMPDRTDRAMQRLYGQAHLGNHIEHHFLLNSWISPERHPLILQSELSDQWHGVHEHYKQLYERFADCSVLDQHMHAHARINLEGLLNRVDSSSMAASVEARVPFTDHRLAEYLFGLPDNLRMRWRDGLAARQGRVMNVVEIDQRNLVESKVMLRRAFGAQVPQAIMSRKKVSFPVPFREWLGSSLISFVTEALGNSDLINRYVRPEAVEALINQAHESSVGLVLWPLVNLALWEKECLQGTAETFSGSEKVAASVS